MAVTGDILESWRRPRAVILRLQARGRSESFVLSFLLTFLLLAFAAAAPGLARQAFAEPGGMTLTQRLYGAALGLLATIPLWYLLAAIGHLIARAFGGRGGFYDGRLALFWALLTVSPAMLVQGLVAGFLGPNGFALGFGVVVGVGFLALWAVLLRAVER